MRSEIRESLKRDPAPEDRQRRQAAPRPGQPASFTRSTDGTVAAGTIRAPQGRLDPGRAGDRHRPGPRSGTIGPDAKTTTGPRAAQPTVAQPGAPRRSTTAAPLRGGSSARETVPPPLDPSHRRPARSGAHPPRPETWPRTPTAAQGGRKPHRPTTGPALEKQPTAAPETPFIYYLMI